MAKGGFPGGMGGMNMNNLMKQAQKMQKQKMEKQEELGYMERYMWIHGYSVFENGLLIKRMDNKGVRENG